MNLGPLEEQDALLLAASLAILKKGLLDMMHPFLLSWCSWLSFPLLHWYCVLSFLYLIISISYLLAIFPQI